MGARYIELFYEVKVPIQFYNKCEVANVVGTSVSENFRQIMEFKLQGLNPNITVQPASQYPKTEE